MEPDGAIGGGGVPFVARARDAVEADADALAEGSVAALESGSGGVCPVSGAAQRKQTVPKPTSSIDCSQSAQGSLGTPASPHKLHARGNSNSRKSRPRP